MRFPIGYLLGFLAGIFSFYVLEVVAGGNHRAPAKERPPLRTHYVCTEAADIRNSFGDRTIRMDRDDGVGGRFVLSGIDGRKLEVGKRYFVSFLEVPTK